MYPMYAWFLSGFWDLDDNVEQAVVEYPRRRRQKFEVITLSVTG
jgi:hypothetical protein